MSKWYHSIIKENIYGFSIQLVIFLSGVLFAIFIPNLLSIEEFAILSIAISVTAIWSIFSDFGLNVANQQISKHLGTGKAWLYYNYIKKWKLLLSFISSILLFLFSDFIATGLFSMPSLSEVLKVGSVWIFFFSLYTFFSQVFIFAKKAKYSLVINAAYQAGRLIFPLILIWYSAKTANAVFIGLSISAGLATLLSFISVRNVQSLKSGITEKIDTSIIKKYVFFGSVLQASELLRQNLDIIILGIFLTATAVSTYKLAMLWITMVPFLIPFSAAVLGAAHAYENEKNSKKIFEKSIHYTFLIAFFFITASFCLSEDFISVFYGEGYAESAFLLKLLSLLALDYALSISSYPVLIGKERIDAYVKIRLSLGILQTIVSVFAIINYGMYGLIASVLVFRLSAAILLFREASKMLASRMVLPIKLGVVSVFTILVLFALHTMFSPSPVLWLLTGSILILFFYLGGAVLLGLLSARDLSIIAEPILNKFFRK